MKHMHLHSSGNRRVTPRYISRQLFCNDLSSDRNISWLETSTNVHSNSVALGISQKQSICFLWMQHTCLRSHAKKSLLHHLSTMPTTRPMTIRAMNIFAFAEERIQFITMFFLPSIMLCLYTVVKKLYAGPQV